MAVPQISPAKLKKKTHIEARQSNKRQLGGANEAFKRDKIVALRTDLKTVFGAVKVLSFEGEMTIFSPYIYAWSKDDSKAFKISNLQDVSKKLSLSHVTLAFLTNDRYEEVEEWISDIRKFDGHVILSIGGASGEYPTKHLTVKEEFDKLLRLLTRSRIRSIDLDIEGETLKNTEKVSKLAKIIKMVQGYFNDDLYVSMTLPIEFEGGLNQDARKAIKLFTAQGVSIRIVNAMIMDYYTKLPTGSSWGMENIRIIKVMHRQMMELFPGKEELEVWHMMGICPMIGYNDDNTVFSLKDWTHVLKFVRSKEIGLISYWAINRDQVASKLEMLKLKKNIYAYSNSQSEDFEYCRKVAEIFK